MPSPSDRPWCHVSQAWIRSLTDVDVTDADVVLSDADVVRLIAQCVLEAICEAGELQLTGRTWQTFTTGSPPASSSYMPSSSNAPMCDPSDTSSSSSRRQSRDGACADKWWAPLDRCIPLLRSFSGSEAARSALFEGIACFCEARADLGDPYGACREICAFVRAHLSLVCAAPAEKPRWNVAAREFHPASAKGGRKDAEAKLARMRKDVEARVDAELQARKEARARSEASREESLAMLDASKIGYRNRLAAEDRAEAAMAALLAEEEQASAAASVAASKKARRKAKKKKAASTAADEQVHSPAVPSEAQAAPAPEPVAATDIDEPQLSAGSETDAASRAIQTLDLSDSAPAISSSMPLVAAATAAAAAAAAAEEEEDGLDELPDEFMCPITCELMADPVMACDGHTYERRAIERWLLKARISPKTGGDLETTALFPNHLLRSKILEWRDAHPAQA